MQNFDELVLPEFLAASLDKIGFVEPTEIQSQAIPAILEGRDLLACAETGSGKTGAYVIPMVKFLLENPEGQALILAPTRELAQQISEFLSTLVPDAREFHTTRLVGGQDIRKQFKSLQKKPRVIVATPGRLIDHIKRNTVQIHKVGFLVLDEGDRMIDMGFAPQLQQILKFLPEDRQTCFFTATLDAKVKDLTKKYLQNPVSLMLGNSRPVASIKQTVMKVNFKDKDECVVNELNQRQGSVIIFLRTKNRTDILHKYLQDYGFSVDLIHGGRTQGQRNRAINAFKKGKVRILCATDVAARGIDVPSVEHVINFDLPMQDEDYVHRVGRTARNGAEGEALSFVMPDEYRDWNRLAKKYQIVDCMIQDAGEGRSSRGPSKKFGKRSGDFGKRSGGGFKGDRKKSGFKKNTRSRDEEGSAYISKPKGKKKFKDDFSDFKGSGRIKDAKPKKAGKFADKNSETKGQGPKKKSASRTERYQDWENESPKKSKFKRSKSVEGKSGGFKKKSKSGGKKKTGGFKKKSKGKFSNKFKTSARG